MKHKQPMSKLALLAVMTTAIAVCFTGCGEDDEKQINPPTVTTTAASAITTTSATLGGKVTSDGGADIISSGVVYSTEDVDLNVESHDFEEATPASDGNFSVVLSGLTSGETYYFQAYAVNKKGISYGTRLNVELGNAAPVATNVAITMDTEQIEIGTVLTADYDYEDAEGDAQGATTYQWYKATDDLGTGEEAIAGATASTYTVLAADEFTYIRVGVTPVATAGTLTGTEVKSAFTDQVPVAPETVTFTYNGQSVTYGVIQSSVTNRKWMDRNLGATQVATSFTSDHAAKGDLFQWGRGADGHQLVVRNTDGSVTVVNAPVAGPVSSITPGNAFITTSEGNWLDPFSDDLWQAPAQTNNPCPTGWHVPTLDEWNAENIDSDAIAINELKLTVTGFTNAFNGTHSTSSSTGFYWPSTPATPDDPSGQFQYVFTIVASGNGLSGCQRAQGNAIRCIKDVE